MNEAFVTWINAELDTRGWSRSEAARRGGISPSMFDKVVGGFANPGLKFCQAVSRAFRIPLDEVLLRAGLAKTARHRPSSVGELNVVYEVADLAARQRVGELIEAYQLCTVRDQEIILDLAQRLAACNPIIIGEEEDS